MAMKFIRRLCPLRRAYWLAYEVFQVKKNVFPHKAVILCADYKSSFDPLSMGKWVTPLKAIPQITNYKSISYLYYNWSKGQKCTIRIQQVVRQLWGLRRTHCDIINVTHSKKFKICTWNMLKLHFPSFPLWCRKIPTYQSYLYYKENKGFFRRRFWRQNSLSTFKGQGASQPHILFLNIKG